MLAGASYALLPFILDEDRYRVPLEMAFSLALERDLAIKGPITLSFSLHPSLILEDVHIANPEWASRPDFLIASRVEAQLSFLALLRKKIEVNRIFLDGVDLLLEEGPNGMDNWTFDSSPPDSAPSSSGSTIFVDMTHESYGAIQRATVAYLPYGASKTEFTLTIIEGIVIPVETKNRRYTFRGTYHEVPFTFDITGAPLHQLLDLDAPWPLEGSIKAVGTILTGKGYLKGPYSTLSLELQGSLQGERLSDLSPFFHTELPSYGPYELVTSLTYSRGILALQNANLKMGDTDLAGVFSLEDRDDRTYFTGKLTAQTLRMEDFLISKTESSLKDESNFSHSRESFIKQLGMEDLDFDLDLSVKTLRYDILVMNDVRLSAKLVNGVFSVTPLQGKVLGGRLRGSLEVNANFISPTVALEARLSDLSYGQALQAFGVTSDVLGSTDVDLALRGSGSNLQELYQNATVTVNLGASDLVYRKEERGEVEEFALKRATVKVTQGGPVKARLLGMYLGEPLDIRMGTAPLGQLLVSSGDWPISLVAQGRQSTLTLQGGLRVENDTTLLESKVTVKGRRPSDLLPTLPATEPYGLQAMLVTDGERITLSGLKGRLGKTDITGDIQVDLKSGTPYFTAQLSSRYFNTQEVFIPSSFDSSEETFIPQKPFRLIEGNITWTFTRLNVKPVYFRNLTLKASLKDGRLDVTVPQGELHNWKKRYGILQGKFAFNATPRIPTIAGNIGFRKLDLGYVINGLQRNGPIAGVGNVNVKFSSHGTIFSKMFGRTTFEVTTENFPLTFRSKTEESKNLAKISRAVLFSKKGGPLGFQTQGLLKESPFTISATAGSLRKLFQERDEWPLKIEIALSQVDIQLHGHLLFPLNGEDFRFQVKVEGENMAQEHLLSEFSAAMPEDLGELSLTGALAQTKEGYTFTEVQLQLGPNDVSGDLKLNTTGERPKLVAILNSNSNEFRFLTKRLSPSLETEDRTMLKRIIGTVAKIGKDTKDTVVGIGSKAGSVMSKSLGIEETDKEGESPGIRVFPDLQIPVDYLRSIDLDLEWHVRRVESKGFHLGNISYYVDLKDGKLELGPLRGELWRGSIDGKIILDASQYVPTVTAQVKLEGLDLGFLDETVGVTDMINGELDLIRLDFNSRGTGVHEILNRANGTVEIVEGEMEINNAYVDLWAADIFTLALSKAWEKEEVTKLNCAVGYFEIEEGVIKSDAILFDTQRITIGGFGSLNLGDEKLDFILTPKPKDPSLVNLSHTVRVSGTLAAPDVTSDKLRIAQGGGWYLLGVINPIGFTVVIPKIAGTTMGTGKENACEEAMEGKELTAKQVGEIHESFWDWMVRKTMGVFGSEEESVQGPNSPKTKTP